MFLCVVLVLTWLWEGVLIGLCCVFVCLCLFVCEGLLGLFELFELLDLIRSRDNDL